MSRRTLCIAFAAALLLPCLAAAQQSAPNPQPPPPPSVNSVSPPHRIRIAGSVQSKSLIHMVPPEYPQIAKTAKISGTVVLHAIIATDGTVKELQYISGPPLLMKAAMDAVKQWQYRPMTFDGMPFEVETTISVVFSLADSAPAPADNPLDPQLKSDIKHLLETMDIQQASEAALRRTFENLKPQLTASLPPTPNRDKIIDAYEDKLAGLVHSPEYEDGLVAIYARHFSDDEIKAIDQFYQTPAGKRLVQTLPDVMSEAESFGQQTAAGSIPRILQELCREFPELQGEAKFCPADTTHRESRFFPPRRTPPFLVFNSGN